MDWSAYGPFASWAKKYGVDAAGSSFRGLGTDVVTAYTAQYLADRERVESGHPLIFSASRDPWYSGPDSAAKYWPPLKQSFLEDGWPEMRVEEVDHASDKVVAHTPRPALDEFRARGLVVGYVQSGKTTNFVSVIAKLADEEYTFVIVLSGIHNGLRRQTQVRLQSQLEDPLPSGWHLLTTPDSDFSEPPANPLTVLSEDKVALAIVKKNAGRLRKLINWLDTPRGRDALSRHRVLIIDDEADQASVATRSVNPLIRKLLSIAPRNTYIGYTATPFANVFIDPATEDLYPKDFILNLPRPEDYFGPEVIFGRDLVEGEAEGSAPDGYDMVRIIPESDVALLRPSTNAQAASFQPVMTSDLRRSVLWFWLATAARRARGDTGHSTMLIHTAVNITVHESFKPLLVGLRDRVGTDLRDPGSAQLGEFRSLWSEETSRVDASDWHGRRQNTFDEIQPLLLQVISETQVILDNSRSVDRLNYPDDASVVAIAIGGDTLSRGLTLEGLVVSFFVRSANSYDTLLQMGRWFGYRTGYEDLPRIWMTSALRLAFRHLASVEHDMRNDIEHYQRQNLTPMEVGVRIKTHPSLRITAKMGAARPAYISYAGRRLQTRYFPTDDAPWLRSNLHAADELVREAAAAGTVDAQDDKFVIRDVPARLILRFLESYLVHADSPDIDPAQVRRYIDRQIGFGEGYLERWSVAVVAGSAESVNLGGFPFHGVIRSRLDDQSSDRADIKTLMSKQDRVLDLSISTSEAKALPELDLMELRNADDAHKMRGLLVIYPINGMSEPVHGRPGRIRLGLTETVIGMGLVFPGDAELRTRVQPTYLAVEPRGLEPDLDVIEEDAEN